MNSVIMNKANGKNLNQDIPLSTIELLNQELETQNNDHDAIPHHSLFDNNSGSQGNIQNYF